MTDTWPWHDAREALDTIDELCFVRVRYSDPLNDIAWHTSKTMAWRQSGKWQLVYGGRISAWQRHTVTHYILESDIPEPR